MIGFRERVVRLAVPVAIVALSGLASCTSAAERAATNFAPVKAKYEPNVGKQYWVGGPLFKLCKEPGDQFDCEQIPPNTRVKVDDVVQGSVKGGATVYYDNSAYYHVVLDDGRDGYSDAITFGISTTETDPAIAAAECARRGQPRIGMNVKQLEASCWGKPDHINRRQTANGIRDQYFYGGGRNVDLHNGIVTSFDQGGMRESRAR